MIVYLAAVTRLAHRKPLDEIRCPDDIPPLRLPMAFQCIILAAPFGQLNGRYLRRLDEGAR